MKLFPVKTRLGYLFNYYYIERTRAHNIKIQRCTSRRIAKDYFVCEQVLAIIVIIKHKKNLLFENELSNNLMCNQINFKLGRLQSE